MGLFEWVCLNGFGLGWVCVGLGGFDHVYKGLGWVWVGLWVWGGFRRGLGGLGWVCAGCVVGLGWVWAGFGVGLGWVWVGLTMFRFDHVWGWVCFGGSWEGLFFDLTHDAHEAPV